jgi:hypothetical protein
LVSVEWEDSMKFEIKSWITGGALFSIETDSWKLAVEAAVKSRADLSGANLSGANLSGANLSGANLSLADLSGANLSGANLSGANLYGANLYGANLYGANLSGANLSGANLSGANLYGANLYGANLYGANLSRAELDAWTAAKTSILPADGPVHGWKKCNDGVMVKVAVGAKAKRSNATGRKCRAEYVKVLEIHGGEVGISQHDGKTEYRVGQIVRCDKWDDNRWAECSNGIHFFLTREEAEAY